MHLWRRDEGDTLQDSKILSEALQLLKNHPEGIVAVVVLGISAGLLVAGVNPVFAIGLPMAIYILYHVRMTAAARHKERMGEIAVTKIESQKGVPARNRARNAIAKRRKIDGH